MYLSPPLQIPYHSTMGAGSTRPSMPVVHCFSYKSVTYCRVRNNIVVVYGRVDDRVRKLEDCVTTGSEPGTCADLMGPTDTICIIKRGAFIRSNGVLRMDTPEALLRMEEGACIEVGVNGRLIIHGMLLMEKKSRLVVESGASLVVVGALSFGYAVTVKVTDQCNEYWNHVHFSIPMTVNADMSYSLQNGTRPVTWSEDDKYLLLRLLFVFCNHYGLPSELAYPLLLPTICQRYGVLMVPKGYKMPQYSLRRSEVKIVKK
jgi:hypothetical protein